MAIVVASMVMLVDTILLRISHLGIKPVRGGSPPNDRMVVEMVIIKYGEEAHMVPISLTVVDDVRLMSMNTGVVVIV